VRDRKRKRLTGQYDKLEDCIFGVIESRVVWIGYCILVGGWCDKFDSFFLGAQARRLIYIIKSREKSYAKKPRIRRLSELRQ
jgi:hypothetical protein